MIIDNKGRISGKVNIVDLTVLVILTLAIFIAIKFIFFNPNFFYYKDVVVEANFSEIPLSNLTHLSKGKILLYLDNDSYLILSEKDFARCSNKRKEIELVYYFNDSYSILAKTLTVNCIHNSKHLSDVHYFNEEYLSIPKTTSFNCNRIDGHARLTYYFNDSYLRFPKESLINCYYDKENISLAYHFYYSPLFPPRTEFIKCIYEKTDRSTNYYFEGLPSDVDEYTCNSILTFKLKARILDTGIFYKNYDYHISKGRYLKVKVEDIILDNGRILNVYDVLQGEEQ